MATGGVEMKLSDFPKAGESVRVMVPGTIIQDTNGDYRFCPDGATGPSHIRYLVAGDKSCRAYRHFVVVKGKRGKKG